jgi:hypothetical protein
VIGRIERQSGSKHGLPFGLKRHSFTTRRTSISASGDILDPDGDDITAAKLAVDREIEHGEVAGAAIDLTALSAAFFSGWFLGVIWMDWD